jgi:pyrroline-5-carboxylate reductase
VKYYLLITIKFLKSDIIVIAVKPQDFKGLGDTLKKVLKPNQIILSIMAGIRISKLEEVFNHSSIVRAMPNSPVEIEMGITGFSSHKEVTYNQLRKVENLLATTGRTVFFENEEQLDAVTALSGSGPAYFYYIVKAMIDAGKEMGVEESVSSMLVRQTMLGAFHLINNANQSLDDLIKIVASKGGTTEAALKTFNEQHVSDGIIKGIINAEKRAKELSSN